MARQELTVSSALTLPHDAVTETFGLLAARGAGKSNGARVLGEEMFKAQLPFVAIDPVGSWWGLRSSRDGKGDGLPIPIFGGRRGDVPLEEESGAFIADLIVERNLTCILDLSRFASEAAKKRFLLDFLRRLYQENETPRHIFFEEADDYLPQQPYDNADKFLLRAGENIVRRGRGRGLGITLITQRSAVLNKNVLEQVQTLFAMRVTGPNDRDAIERWVKFHGERKEIVATLAQLKDGEAWLYSPEYLKVVKRFRFRLTKTFDSGRTPKMADVKQAPATLREIDLGKLRKSMAATIEKVEQTDPKRLQAKINELTKQLAGKRAQEPRESPALAIEREVAKQLVPIKRAARVRAQKLNAAVYGVHKAIVNAQDAMRSLREIVDAGLKEEGQEAPSTHVATVHAARALASQFDEEAKTALAMSRKPAGRLLAEHSAALSVNGVKLSTPQQAMLNALAWSESIGIEQLLQGQLATMTKQAPTSRGFAANMSRLRTSNLVSSAGKNVQLTDVGKRHAQSFDAPLSLSEYHAALCEMLSTPQAKMLRTLLTVRSMSHDALARATDQERESRGYQANVSKLVSMRFAERTDDGLTLSEIVFPPGLT